MATRNSTDESTAQAVAAAPAGEPYEVTSQIGHLLRRAYQRHTSLFQQVIPDSQLTAAQFVALCTVRELGKCSLNEIVVKSAIDQATMRGVVERLGSRGLLATDRDPNDGRKLAIFLTDAGQRLVQDMVPFAKQITEITFGDMNPGERLALLYLLRKMCDAGASVEG